MYTPNIKVMYAQMHELRLAPNQALHVTSCFDPRLTMSFIVSLGNEYTSKYFCALWFLYLIPKIDQVVGIDTVLCHHYVTWM